MNKQKYTRVALPTQAPAHSWKMAIRPYAQCSMPAHVQCPTSPSARKIEGSKAVASMADADPAHNSSPGLRAQPAWRKPAMTASYTAVRDTDAQRIARLCVCMVQQCHCPHAIVVKHQQSRTQGSARVANAGHEAHRAAMSDADAQRIARLRTCIVQQRSKSCEVCEAAVGAGFDPAQGQATEEVRRFAVEAFDPSSSTQPVAGEPM